eukprot:scaffold79226_cov64-Phaeocystis_antarctica.AAC.2
MKLASRPVKLPKFPAARAVQRAAPPPPGGGAAPPHPKSATLTATIMHAWFGPPVDVPGARGHDMHREGLLHGSSPTRAYCTQRHLRLQLQLLGIWELHRTDQRAQCATGRLCHPVS